MGRGRFSRPGSGGHTARDGEELWPPVLRADSPEAVDGSFPRGKCVGLWAGIPAFRSLLSQLSAASASLKWPRVGWPRGRIYTSRMGRHCASGPSLLSFYLESGFADTLHDHLLRGKVLYECEMPNLACFGLLA